MTTRADLIIVGAGLAGSAAAWAASARGLDVVLLDHFLSVVTTFPSGMSGFRGANR